MPMAIPMPMAMVMPIPMAMPMAMAMAMAMAMLCLWLWLCLSMTMSTAMYLILYPMTMLYEHHRVMDSPLNWTNSPQRMIQFNANGFYDIHTQFRFETSQFKSQVKTIINIQISTQSWYIVHLP